MNIKPTKPMLSKGSLDALARLGASGFKDVPAVAAQPKEPSPQMTLPLEAAPASAGPIPLVEVTLKGLWLHDLITDPDLYAALVPELLVGYSDAVPPLPLGDTEGYVVPFDDVFEEILENVREGLASEIGFSHPDLMSGTALIFIAETGAEDERDVPLLGLY